MSSYQRFAIGGVGGLLPLVVSFLAFDPATVITYLGALPLGIYVGYAIKTFLLFVFRRHHSRIERQQNAVDSGPAWHCSARSDYLVYQRGCCQRPDRQHETYELLYSCNILCICG